MIIDSHSHVMLPAEKHIALMDEAGVDKTILFSTSMHPEVAQNLEEYEKELNKLYDIIFGKKNNMDAKINSIKEQCEVIKKYPSRFYGFGNVPVVIGHLGGLNWLDTIKMAKEVKNVYIDLSAFYAAVQLSMVIKELPDRCLFSTDLPFGDLAIEKFAIERVCKDKVVREQVMGEMQQDFYN